MICFKNWKIEMEGPFFIQQFDNLTRTLTVKGNLPEGWEWVMLVEKGDNMDILPLEAVDGGIGITLTKQQLAYAGKYHLQLRGTKGEMVRHTDMITVDVDKSLSGDIQWPEIPSRFSELEERVNTAVNRAEQAVKNYPVIGENGNWWKWDGECYADTGKPSRGEQGVPGKNGPAGYTPVKGVDYYTEADKQELLNATKPPFFVPITQPGGVLTAGATLKEILEAVAVGRLVYATCYEVGAVIIMPLIASSEEMAVFSVILDTVGNDLVISADNTVSVNAYKLLTRQELNTELLPEAINTALEQAKASGEFDGKDGADGYTPVKGADYFTDADKQEMVDAVLAALPAAEGVAY